MTPVRVRVPSALRGLCDGRSVLTVDVDAAEPPTVAHVLDRLAADVPALERRVRDETGTVRRHVNLFVGEVNVRDLDGLDTPLGEAAELTVLPAVSGGQRHGSSPDQPRTSGL